MFVLKRVVVECSPWTISHWAFQSQTRYFIAILSWYSIFWPVLYFRHNNKLRTPLNPSIPNCSDVWGVSRGTLWCMETPVSKTEVYYHNNGSFMISGKLYKKWYGHLKTRLIMSDKWSDPARIKQINDLFINPTDWWSIYQSNKLMIYLLFQQIDDLFIKCLLALDNFLNEYL